MRIRPHWRKMSWVVLIFNALMVIWLITSLTATTKGGCTGLTVSQCAGVADVAHGAVAVIQIVLWLIGDFILGIIWLVTKGNRRLCPACGLPVKAGTVQCKKCGYDFRSIALATAYAAPGAPPTIPAGWFPDPQGSGQLRYWDGSQWTATIRPN